MGFAQKIAPMIQAWLDCETGITYREPKIGKIPSAVGILHLPAERPGNHVS